MKNLLSLFLGGTLLIVIMFLGCKKDSPTETKTTGKIIGQVTDSTSGVAIAAVDVTINTQPTATVGNTDDNGNYTIDNISPGTYNITATKTGYNPSSKSASVTAGNTTTSNIILSRVMSVTGKWEQNFSLSGTAYTGYYNLVQNGTQLTGDFVFNDGSGYTTLHSSSSINGKNINIVWYLESYKLSYTGTVSNDFNSMSGNMYLNTITTPVCTWTAHRVTQFGKVAIPSSNENRLTKTLVNILSSFK